MSVPCISQLRGKSRARHHGTCLRSAGPAREGQPPEAGKVEETGSSWSLRESTALLTDSSILAHGNALQTPGLWCYERINVCCVKPPRLW